MNETKPEVPPNSTTQTCQDKANASVNNARTIPYYFAALAGLVYAVGFLVEFTFMNSIGVKDSLTEPFKAKHIYVGFLCLQYPASVILVVLSLLKVYRNPKEKDSPADAIRLKIYGPSASLFIIFLTAFYLLIAFARPDSLSLHAREMMVLFVISVLGPSVMMAVFSRLGDKLTQILQQDDEKRKSDLRNKVQETLATAQGKTESEVADAITVVVERTGVSPKKQATSAISRFFMVPLNSNEPDIVMGFVLVCDI